MWVNKPFLLFLIVLLISSKITTGTTIPVAAHPKAVIDLRNQSFDKIVTLGNQWEFYWNQLLEPGDTLAKGGKLVNFPYKWKGFGYATYKVTVLLPHNRKSFVMGMPETYTSYKLYVNGKLEAVNGRVGTTKETAIPYWQPQTVPVSANVDTLNLLLQVSNFVHSKGGVKKPIKIGSRDQLLLNLRQSSAINLVLTGCMLMGGLFFMGLYLLGKNDKAIL